MGLPGLMIVIMLAGGGTEGLSSKNEYTYFTSAESSIEVLLGSSTSITCSVARKANDTKLDWWFLNRGIQLTCGSFRLVRNFFPGESFSYISEKHGGCTSTISIGSMEEANAGFYKCQFSNNTGTYFQITRLVITGYDRGMETSRNYKNMTGCCEAFGISGKCLDLCNPFYSFHANVSATDLIKEKYKDCGGKTLLALMECGRGRNNIPCCLERNVTLRCSALCDGIFQAGADLDSCSGELSDMALCFSRGLATIPPPPAEVFVSDVVESNYVSVEWSAVEEVGDVTTSWMVLQWNATLLGYEAFEYDRNTTIARCRVESNSVGRFAVVAVGPWGASSSRGDYEVEQWSLPFVMNSSKYDLTTCCLEQKVPLECLSTVCGVLNNNNNDISTERCSCYPHVGRAMQCLSGILDRTDCCVRHKTSSCLPLCRGSVAVVTMKMLQCLDEMPFIRSCLDGKIARPDLVPRRLLISNVTCCNATLSWLPPSEENQAASFILRYRDTETDREFTNLDVSSLDFVLQKLMPNTEYEVFLVAVMSGNVTFPSTVVKFRTRMTPDLWTSSPTPRDPAADGEDDIIIEVAPNIPYIPMGEKVTMTCSSKQIAECRWTKGASGINNSIWEIMAANETSSGSYTCICGQKQRSHDLKVQGVPTVIVSASERVIIHPLTNCHAELTCNFSGFPEKIAWYKDGQEVTIGSSLPPPNVPNTSPTILSSSATVTSRTFLSPSSVSPTSQQSSLSSSSSVRPGSSSSSSSTPPLRQLVLTQETSTPNGPPDFTTTPKMFGPANTIPLKRSLMSKRELLCQTNRKYASTKCEGEKEGIVCFKLTIEPYNSSDTGAYTCVGSNSYGSDSGTLYLTSDENFKPPPLRDEHPDSVLECCGKMNVSDECMPACSFEVDFDRLMFLPWNCYSNFHTIMECSSRGWNYSSCCLKADIPTTCQSLCQGGGATSNDLACECISYADELITCHASGHSFIPDPPTSMNQSILANGLLSLTFTRPKDKLKLISGYYVNWTSLNDTDVEGYQVLATNTTTFYGYDLEPYNTYKFTFQSHNKHGFSNPFVPAPIYQSDSPVLEKLDVSLAVSGNEYIRVTWKRPEYAYVQKYVVSFFPGDNASDSSGGNAVKQLFQKESGPQVYVATSDAVERGKWYHVTALIRSSANYEGPPSDVRSIYVPQKSLTAGEIAAIVVCVTVGVVFIVIAIVACIRYRRKKTHFQSPVSFENTHYRGPGEPKVHLPELGYSESLDDNVHLPDVRYRELRDDDDLDETEFSKA